MVEKSGQIVEKIRTHRDRLGQDLSDLELRVRQTANWRTHYDKHPSWFIGAAIGSGILLSALLSGRSHRSNGYSRRNDLSGHSEPRPGPFAEVVDQVKVALVSFGVAKAKEVLAEVVPGFRNTEGKF